MTSKSTARGATSSALVCLLLVPTLLAGCSEDSGDSNAGKAADIATTPLSGVMNGKPWTFQMGHTDPFFDDESGTWTELYASTFTPCSPVGGSGDALLLTIPREPGTYTSQRPSLPWCSSSWCIVGG